MACQAAVKSFNDTKGWGFIDYEGQDVFLHVKDCVDGNRPVVGDVVEFDIEDDQVRPGNMKALNVSGCSGVKGQGKGAPPMMAQRMPMMAQRTPMMARSTPMMARSAPTMRGAPMMRGNGGFQGGCAYQSAGGCRGGGAKRYPGRVKSYNDAKGWGFIDYQGVDVFIHVKDCGDARPEVGDIVTFEMEEDSVRQGQMKANNVLGCTGTKGGCVGKGGGYGACYGGGCGGGCSSGPYGTGKGYGGGMSRAGGYGQSPGKGYGKKGAY
mmetsp:Transcript_12619/g.28852  ORF Transcript_12619/g.28852 Transcript_12619/m.28852 type:complete len:266 (+) Transcript_12619:92-889(+)